MSLAAGVLLAMAAMSVQESAEIPPEPVAPLHTLLTADDYPPEAIGKGEEGTVEMRLAVDSDGRVGGCTITSSSGSATLDSTSCRIMTERARFRPARDAQGKPVASEMTQRLTWRLADTQMAPRTHAAFMLWTSCAVGEAAKLAFTDLATEAIAARAFQPCAALEAVVARELGSKALLRDSRAVVTQMIERGLVQARSAFEEEAEEPASR